MAGDVHIRRSGNDYIVPYEALLPQGQAWPRDIDSLQYKYIGGAAQIWGDFDRLAANLLEIESDPRSTVVLLPDWERNFGLPDDCLNEPLTIGDRQIALTMRITMQGGQSRPFFIALAETIKHAILIVEHSPYQCGISSVGDTRNWNGEDSQWFRWELGAETMRFYWTIQVLATRLTWFRTGGGGGQCGVDPMLRMSIASDLECIMQRYKPGHTELAFDYGGLIPFNRFSGTDRDETFFLPPLVPLVANRETPVPPVSHSPIPTPPIPPPPPPPPPPSSGSFRLDSSILDGSDVLS